MLIDDNQAPLNKGEMMEEKLRGYFLSLGYFVVRSIKFNYEGNAITDIDLYLYNRTSSMERTRINVDIKNKKVSQAFERILWTNGLMKVLKLDGCVVATMDNRDVVQSFGKIHNTTVLNKSFLSKLKDTHLQERLTEEEFISLLAPYESYRNFLGKKWPQIYEQEKSRLLTELDYSGINANLISLRYFTDKILYDENKKAASLRMMYIIISYFLIISDFVLKEVAFYEQEKRGQLIKEGLKFGNLGKLGVDRILTMITSVSSKQVSNAILEQFDNISSDILSDFLGKNDIAKNLFRWGKDFEVYAFNKTLIFPEKMESHHKAVISILLDYMQIDRRKFFDKAQ